MKVEMNVGQFLDDIDTLIDFYNYYMHDGDGMAEKILSDLDTTEKKLKYFEDQVVAYKRLKAFYNCSIGEHGYQIKFFDFGNFIALISDSFDSFEQVCNTKGLECLINVNDQGNTV